MIKTVFFRLEKDADDYPPVSVESVWAKETGTALELELNNVPFFAKEATLGDTVKVSSADGVFWYERMVRRSSNSLVRAIFFDEERVDTFSTELESLGCPTEYLRQYAILAISVPAGVRLADVQEPLRVAASQGVLDYEEPILRHSSAGP